MRALDTLRAQLHVIKASSAGRTLREQSGAKAIFTDRVKQRIVQDLKRYEGENRR